MKKVLHVRDLKYRFFHDTYKAKYINQTKEELASIGARTGCVRIRTWGFSLIQAN